MDKVEQTPEERDHYGEQYTCEEREVEAPRPIVRPRNQKARNVIDVDRGLDLLALIRWIGGRSDNFNRDRERFRGRWRGGIITLMWCWRWWGDVF
ncbi:hypothetical protein TSUD_187320 [Trifolium subterraneum]|uniref:Uncharacterized protein n=1 Tax=Trifolium subterraneum TaxID=3900 RepID=A0A2Z6PIZ3_TRISU|nr:hypothetical protein TSUD_187320 [Trifolium subterraneum]